MVKLKPIILAALLLELSLARAQEFSVSNPPPGYAWVFIPNTSTAVLRPEDWFVTARTNNGTIACFITHENLQVTGQFQTGLTFNFVPKVSQTAGLSAIRYAAAFIQEAQQTKEVLLEPWVNESAPGLFGMGIRYRQETEDSPVIVHNFLIADDLEDSIRLFIFESPETNWDAAWKVGEVLMRVEISRD